VRTNYSATKTLIYYCYQHTDIQSFEYSVLNLAHQLNSTADA